jgi:hypothetical protein
MLARNSKHPVSISFKEYCTKAVLKDEHCFQEVEKKALGRESRRTYHRWYYDVNDSRRAYLREYYLRNKGRWIKKKKVQESDEAKVYLREYDVRNREKRQDYLNARGGRSDVNDSRRAYQREYYIRNIGKEKNRKESENAKQYPREYTDRNKEKKQDYDHSISQEKYARTKDTIRDYSLRYYLQNRTSSDIYSPRDKAVKSWKTPELVREYFESIRGKLLITNYTDWYRISQTQLAKLGGVHSLLKYFLSYS